MKLILTLTAIFLAFYTSLSVANDWNIKTAYQLAVASDCAYGADKGIPEVRSCFKNAVDAARGKGSDVLDIFANLPESAIEVFETKGEHVDKKINAAIVVKIPKGAILAFRGTEGSYQDWLHNIFLTSIKNVSKGEIFDDGRHYGFNQSLESLSKQIKAGKIWPHLKDQSNNILYITGHSKGGALATGATVDLHSEFENIETYTFEAARFFTSKGVNNHKSVLDGKIWRFEYQYDIVPHVPLGKVTYDFLLENKRFLDYFGEKFFPENLNKDWLDWLAKVENNNINFVPAGRLAYVDGDDNVSVFSGKQPDQIDLKYYRTRFAKSLGMTAMTIFSDIGQFVKEQHSDCYLGYLKAKAINIPITTELSENCISK